MTNEQIERCDALWRELLAAGEVRWMEGMHCLLRGHGMTTTNGDAPTFCIVPNAVGALRFGVIAAHEILPSSTPLWRHPATIGCLLAMAREATGEPRLYVADVDGLWCVVVGTGRRMRCVTVGATEPEAMLLAIKDAN